MKRVIDGLLYDTEKSTLLGSFSFGEYGDFSHYSEELYRTAGGRLFLAGSGGPNSKYAVNEGRLVHGSETIIVFTEEDAFNWACENNRTDCIMENFTKFIADA